MKKTVIIGAGISGLAMATLLKEKGQEVVVFEMESLPGGLIKCDRVDGNLFHRTGGHVFNTKRQDVLDWFWKHFDKERDFTKALRNSSVAMPEGMMIPYPIENHAYLFDESTKKAFIEDLVIIAKAEEQHPKNFEDFLRGRFGATLYNIYFQPYNYKVWRRDLKNVSLSWLEGKLPMPTVTELIYNNINHVEERTFVHSSFFYAKKDGSQFIANELAKNLDIRYDKRVESLELKGNKWLVNSEEADCVVFCGNIKQLPSLVERFVNLDSFVKPIMELESHGTTSVFFEIEQNPYSWIYLPCRAYESHRIICTGNFTPSNNSQGKMTATIEFTDAITKEEILENLSRMPYSPKYLAHHYEQYTYPIQSATTGEMISSLKHTTEASGLYLLGRFAEWEYYNMDVAIGAAIDLIKRL